MTPRPGPSAPSTPAPGASGVDPGAGPELRAPQSLAVWRLYAVVAALLLGTAAGRGGRSVDRDRRERGDVPGWVLITLMTAGLVTMLWAVAGEQLRELFTTALAAVTGPTR